MKIVLITPGTGSYHCGVCLRDNALARELIAQGHEAVMLPMYLPLTLDQPSASPQRPIFFGGINVYLQQKFAFFRHTPAWLDRWLNHPALLRLAGRQSGMTGGAEIGEMTLSMLRGEEGLQAKELEKLVSWLVTEERPDAIWLSTALLVGLARRLQQALGSGGSGSGGGGGGGDSAQTAERREVAVLCSLQGEDSFLDGLEEPWRSQCWQALAERSRDVDGFVSPSRYYAAEMGPRLGLSGAQLRVIANGIAVEGPVLRQAEVPTVGYLARMVEGKGLRLVVEAFIHLKRQPEFQSVRLRCAGAMTAGDEPFVAQLRNQLEKAGCAGDVEFLSNVTWEQKREFYGSLTLFSVPATYGEAFGLYLLEAMAMGVPVVQPRAAAFEEIVEKSGGGLLCEPGSAQSLAESWSVLLKDPARAAELGRRGRLAVEGEFSISRMARAFVDLSLEIIDGKSQPH